MCLRPLVVGDLEAPVPVIQGGMGVGVSLSGLAGAVAAEGGVGVISAAQIGYAEPGFDDNPVETNLAAIGTQIRKAREIARGGVIGINIMAATYRYEEYVKAAVLAGADIILSGAGLPAALPALVAGSGTKIAPIVSSLKSVQVILKYWMKKYGRVPDLVVIEGPLAGGHLGFSEEELADMEALEYDRTIEQIIAFVKEWEDRYMARIPVAIAGGIYGAQEMRRCIALGADAVQVATRFVTTYECDADDRYKQAYIDADKEDIVIVKSPVGMPGRALNNRFVRMPPGGGSGKCHRCISKCNPAAIPYCITDALVNAVRGRTDEGLIFCGATAWRSDKMEHVADVMREFREFGEG